MSYAGLGQTLAMPGETVGLDHSGSRRVSGGAVQVGARWAQRAANAGNRYNNSSAPLIGVDNHAGPITIAALRTLSHQFASDQPVTNSPAGTRVTDTVIIPLALETALASKTLIPDPPLSTATHRTATTSTGASVPAPIPGAPPAAPADQVILDEGSSSGAGGLIARYGIWPWAIGGAALVGVGIWFMSGGGMRANRRRVRRNSKHKIRRSSAPWNYPCPACGATELGKFGHGPGCVLARHSRSFLVPKRKKRVRRNDGESFQTRLNYAWSLYSKGDKAGAKRELAEAKKLAATKEDRFHAQRLDVRLSGYLGDPHGRGHRLLPSKRSKAWLEMNRRRSAR